MRRLPPALLLLVLGAGASLGAGREQYDPEIALLAFTINKESLPLLRSELERQAEWLGFSGVKLLIDHAAPRAEAEIRSRLSAQTDVLQGFRDRFVQHSPTAAPEVERLVAEIRMYHDLRLGSPLERFTPPPLKGRSRALTAESGVGADVAEALLGTQALTEPTAYAGRRFGSTGPFLRKRKWNIDFYLGAFDDLVPHYRKLGYQTFYRLRAPYISYGKEAYLLGPEPGKALRPRLVYCNFSGPTFFLHTRAQYAILRKAAGGADPTVRTLTCEECRWTSPALVALRRLLDASPYQAENLLMGYDFLFENDLSPLLLGVYDNEHWRLRYYDAPAGITAVILPRRTGFGDITGAAVEEFIARGAKTVYYAGPAFAVGPDISGGRLYAPETFLDAQGTPIKLKNSLRARRSGRHQSVASPLLATLEWEQRARDAGIETSDCELSHIAERAARLGELRGQPATLALGIIATSLSHLHPEEDRALYTVSDRESGEQAQEEFRSFVMKRLTTSSGRDRSRL